MATATFANYPGFAYLMYPDQEFVLDDGSRMTGMELFINAYGKQQSQGSYQGYHTYSGALTKEQYDKLPERIKKYFTTYGTESAVSKTPKYIFNDTVENQASITKDVQTYYSNIYTPDFIKKSKLPDYFKTQTSPTSIYNPTNKEGVAAASNTGSPSNASTSEAPSNVYDKTSYPAEAPTALPDPMSYNDFVSTYFPDRPSGISDSDLQNEYADYTQSFRDYVMSRTQYYDPASGEYKYRELPAWETVEMHRYLTTDDNGKPKASYANPIAQPTEDYTTYVDTTTGGVVTHPLRTRGEQTAQGWYVTRDQLNNIIYDAENGAFRAPASKATPSTTPTTASPTATETTMSANNYSNPTYNNYQGVATLGQGAFVPGAASWTRQYSPSTQTSLASLAASLKPRAPRTPTFISV